MSAFPVWFHVYICYLISLSISVTIDWNPWIDLPIANSQMLLAMHYDLIYAIGGRKWKTNSTKIYRINASLTPSSISTQKWETIKVHNKGEHGYPKIIEIKNDNYVAIGEYIYLFNPFISNQSEYYMFSMEKNEFVINPQIQPPPNNAANPCVAFSKPYVYVIGGTTYQDNEKIDCLSTLSALNMKTLKWDTYSNIMPWSNTGSCYNLCQAYEGYLYLFGGVVGGTFPTFLDHVYAVDIS